MNRVLRPDPQAPDPATGIDALSAAVRDPLWMLARQWQTGGFLASDGGSTVEVDMTYATSTIRLTGVELTGPVEPMVEAEELPALNTLDTAARVRLATELTRCIRDSGLDANTLGALRAALAAAYSLNPADQAGPLHSYTGRLPDPAGLCTALAATIHPDGTGEPFPTLPGFDNLGAHLDTVQTSVRRWYAWVSAQVATGAGPAGTDPGSWDPLHLEYAFDLGTNVPDGTVGLRAAGYDGSGVDWYTFDRGPVGLDPGFRRSLTWALENLAIRFRAANQPDDAATAAREAIEVLQVLLQNAVDPDNAPTLANRLISLAAFVPPAEAVHAVERAVATYRELAGVNPADPGSRRSLARALQNLSTHLLAAGQPDDAAAAAHEADLILAETDPPQPGTVPNRLAHPSTATSPTLRSGGTPLIAAEAVLPPSEIVESGRGTDTLTPLEPTEGRLAANPLDPRSQPELGPPTDTDQPTPGSRSITVPELERINELVNSAAQLRAAGRVEEAAAAAREAIGIIQILIPAHRDVDMNGAAAALISLADYLPPAEAVDAARDAVTIYRRATGEIRNVTVRPTPVSYPGMPRPRFWEFEDGDVNLDSLRIDGALENPAHGALAAFAHQYSNDWFVIPLALPSGVCTIPALTVRDTFGNTTAVESAAHLDGDQSPWHLWDLTSTGGNSDGATGMRLFLPTAPTPLEGPVLEEVLVARDEMANLAWVIELTTQDHDGRRVDRYQRWLRLRQPSDPTYHPAVGRNATDYRLGTAVPDHWYPLVAAPSNDGMPVLALADLPKEAIQVSDEGVRGVLISHANGTRISDEEASREGTWLVRRRRLIQCSTGPLSWMTRTKSAGRGESSSGLRFDITL